MSNLKKVINGVEYDLTQEEINQMEQDVIKGEQYRIAFEAEKQARANAKASALAKLQALGLTEEEVKAIL